MINLSDKWLNPDHIRLCAGEITPEEMRTVLAVLRAVFAEAKAKPDITSGAVNSASWAFVNAMPSPIPAEVWNQIKPAVHAAITSYLQETFSQG